MVSAAAFSPDGQLLVTSSWDNSAKVWDAATGQVVVKLDGAHSGYVNAAEFSPAGDGTWIVTASDDGTARLWQIVDDVQTDDSSGRPITVKAARVRRTFAAHTRRVRHASFSPDGRFVLTASDDKSAMIWDTHTKEELSQRQLPNEPLVVTHGP